MILPAMPNDAGIVRSTRAVPVLQLNRPIAEGVPEQSLNCSVEVAGEGAEPDAAEGAVDKNAAVAVDQESPLLLAGAVSESVSGEKEQRGHALGVEGVVHGVEDPEELSDTSVVVEGLKLSPCFLRRHPALPTRRGCETVAGH